MGSSGKGKFPFKTAWWFKARQKRRGLASISRAIQAGDKDTADELAKTHFFFGAAVFAAGARFTLTGGAATLTRARTRYVNTASTAGGDGTTNATSGANRAYPSLSAMEAAEQGDLVSQNILLEVWCCGSAADTTAVDFAGWTTDATRFVRIRQNPGQSQYSNTGSGTRLTVTTCDYFECIGLRFEATSIGSVGVVQVSVNGFPSPGRFLFERNTIVYSGSTLTSQFAIGLNSDSRAAHYLSNNYVYGLLNDGSFPGRAAGISINSNQTCYLQHNTVDSCATGIAAGGTSNIRVANNLLTAWQDNAVSPASSAGWATGSGYNVSNSSPTLPGSSNVTGVTITYSGTGNVHTSDTDAVISNNLYADASYPITVDFDGDARPTSGNVYAGADQPTAGAYTLTAAQGSFTLSGQAAILKAARVVSAAQGSYALTGQPALLKYGRTLTAAQGSFALTGQAAILKAARVLTAAQGSYLLTGQSALLKKGFSLLASQGSFALTGQAAILKATRILGAAQGTYTLAGQAAALKRAFTLVSAQGAFTLSGQAATLRATRTIAAAQGSFALTGQPAALLRGLRLTAAQGSFSLAGQAAGLIYTPVGSYTLSAQRGLFSLTGQDAGLLLGRRLVSAQGSLALTGQPAATLVARRLIAAQGSCALTGQAAPLLFGRRLISSQGSFVLAGQAAALAYGRKLTAADGVYLLFGQAAGLKSDRRVTAVYGLFVLTGKDAELSLLVLQQPIRSHPGHGREFSSPGSFQRYSADGQQRTLSRAGAFLRRSSPGSDRVYSKQGRNQH